ncbi:MAG TPA: hypothetical protein VFC46_00505 [Humisphaera sp.]|nr:hypothetical protein [Humisphaera sp.]
MPNPPPARKSKLTRLFAILLLLGVVLITFGISGPDEAAFRAFDESVDRWQTNPEFRAVAIDYCIGGSRAMMTRPFLIPAKSTIMTLRSAPGLPKKYAVNATSALHYQNFSRGPLSAYLHLCSEQDVPDMIGIIEAAGRKPRRTPDDLRQVLDGFHMDFPVAHDAGAMASVEDLLADTDAGKTFAIRTNIGPMLLAPIAQIAADLHVPANPKDMSADEQRAVLDRLDRYLKSHDQELWRTRQVSDLCGGVWAQVYGPPYRAVVAPLLIAKEVCRWVLVGGLVIAIFGVARRRSTTIIDKLLTRETS